MRTISLRGVQPDVFVGEKLQSQLWLADVSFSKGRACCVRAASGTGKTSLCSFIMGVRSDYRGIILFDDADIRRLSADGWSTQRRSHLAYLPQELELFDGLTALDNVLLKNRLTDFKTESEIRAMFRLLEIDNRINQPAGRLSVGQKQRVAFIRALCQPFDFILLDEPVSHLDSRNNALCADLLTAEARAQGAGIIATSVGNPLAIAYDQILEL